MAPRLVPSLALVLDAETHGLSSPGLEAVIRRFARVRSAIRVGFATLDNRAAECRPIANAYEITLNPHACRWREIGSYSALGTYASRLVERSEEEYRIEVVAKLLHELRHAWQYESSDQRWEKPVTWTTAEEPRYYYRVDEVDARAYADKHIAAAWVVYNARRQIRPAASQSRRATSSCAYATAA